MSYVEYLGYQISQSEIQALQNQAEAFANAPTFINIQEVCSFFELLNYYGKFVHNLSTMVQPLNALLQAGKSWNWTSECTQAFHLAKQQLTFTKVLAHCDPKLPINLAADASIYAVGAVISYVFPDGSEKPIAYASRTLSSSERNNTQVEKEALSLVFGIKKISPIFIWQEVQSHY